MISKKIIPFHSDKAIIMHEYAEFIIKYLFYFKNL